jgi:hypothetical protein
MTTSVLWEGFAGRAGIALAPGQVVRLIPRVAAPALRWERSPIATRDDDVIEEPDTNRPSGDPDRAREALAME